jgi:hypothetical protein
MGGGAEDASEVEKNEEDRGYQPQSMFPWNADYDMKDVVLIYSVEVSQSAAGPHLSVVIQKRFQANLRFDATEEGPVEEEVADFHLEVHCDVALILVKFLYQETTLPVLVVERERKTLLTPTVVS